MRAVLTIVLFLGVSVAVFAQTPGALDLNGKLRFHVEDSLGLSSVGMSGVTAAYLQITNSPREWGRSGGGYVQRVGSLVAYSGIRGALALGLDSTLHQDPRYYRSVSTGFWRRAGHALRGTILTRTDKGGETLSTWRLGSAYGAAFISNQWYPDRLNNARRGFINGSALLAFDFAGNLATEFWPDIRRKISRRKPQI